MVKLKTLQILEAYIFCILQYFATKLGNFTNFKMLFQVVVIDFIPFDKNKLPLNWRMIHCNFVKFCRCPQQNVSLKRYLPSVTNHEAIARHFTVDSSKNYLLLQAWPVVYDLSSHIYTTISSGGLPACCVACRLDKIHVPLHCIPKTKGSVRTRRSIKQCSVSLKGSVFMNEEK